MVGTGFSAVRIAIRLPALSNPIKANHGHWLSGGGKRGHNRLREREERLLGTAPRRGNNHCRRTASIAPGVDDCDYRFTLLIRVPHHVDLGRVLAFAMQRPDSPFLMLAARPAA